MPTSLRRSTTRCSVSPPMSSSPRSASVPRPAAPTLARDYAPSPRTPTPSSR
jgi:hypothetical protein